MNTRSDLTLRLALTLCAALLMLVVCGGLLALADAAQPPLTTEEPLQTDAAASESESAAETVGETTAAPVPGDGTETDQPADTTLPEDTLPTPSDTTAVPEEGTTVPDTLETTAPEGEGETQTTEPPAVTDLPITTEPPAVTTVITTVVTTTKATTAPTYSTMPITSVGAMQSAPADPLSTDGAVTAPVTTVAGQSGTLTTPSTTGETVPQTVPATTSSTRETAPLITGAPAEQEDPAAAAARSELLTTLVITFAVITVLSVAALLAFKTLRP